METEHRKTLIAQVRALGHSDREICRRIGLDPGQFGRIAAGTENMPPEIAALLADLVGRNSQEAAARQMIENAKEPRKSMLERALFTCAAVGACLVSGTLQHANAATTIDNIYIVHSFKSWILRCASGVYTRARRWVTSLVPGAYNTVETSFSLSVWQHAATVHLSTACATQAPLEAWP